MACSKRLHQAARCGNPYPYSSRISLISHPRSSAVMGVSGLRRAFVSRGVDAMAASSSLMSRSLTGYSAPVSSSVSMSSTFRRAWA